MLSFVIPSILSIIFAFLSVIFTVISAIKKENKKFAGFAAIISVFLTFMTYININVPAPTIYPLDNEVRTYNNKVEVMIDYIDFPFSHTYYSLDGSEPRTGNIYENPFIITKSTTVSARNKFLLWWSDISQNSFKFEEEKNKEDNTEVDNTEVDNTEEMLQSLKDKGVPFHRLQLTYIDKSIEITKISGDFVTMCGDFINTLNINEIKLTNIDYDISFTEYTIEEIDDYGTLKTVIIFDEVPAGNYELVSNIDGYQVLATQNMRLSTDRMQGIIGVEEMYWGRQIGLVNNNSSMLLPYYITVIDENKNGMNNIDCMFQYKDNMEFGKYTTTEDGNIPLCFMAAEGEKITVIMREVFNWNDEYTCEVTFNDVKNPPVIVLYSDGRSEQICENEYLGFYK